MTSSSGSVGNLKYVPILKAKKGESDALSRTRAPNLTPLLEVMDTRKALNEIPKAWPTDQGPIWVHVLDDPEDEFSDYPQSLTDFFNGLEETMLPVPVVTPFEHHDVLNTYSTMSAVRENGITVRIDAEEMLDPNIDINRDIQYALDVLGLLPNQVNLVLDGGLLTGSPRVQSALALQALHSLKSKSWHEVVVAFSAFPQAVGNVAVKSSVTALAREDALAFNQTKANSPLEITYGDYGIGTPTYGQASYSPIPNLKYASGMEWKIHRGESRNDPSPQIRAIAKDIVQSSYFSGTDFSPADKMINDIASSASGPGNATTHVSIGMCRHFHVVLDRLSNLGEP